MGHSSYKRGAGFTFLIVNLKLVNLDEINLYAAGFTLLIVNLCKCQYIFV